LVFGRGIRYRGRQSILVSEDTFSGLGTDLSIKRGGDSLVFWIQLTKQKDEIICNALLESQFHKTHRKQGCFKGRCNI
jgi:hypothetical protein